MRFCNHIYTTYVVTVWTARRINYWLFTKNWGFPTLNRMFSPEMTLSVGVLSGTHMRNWNLRFPALFRVFFFSSGSWALFSGGFTEFPVKTPEKRAGNPNFRSYYLRSGRFWWRHFRSLSFRAASGDVTLNGNNYVYCINMLGFFAQCHSIYYTIT
jgi:hypothetical protein